MKKRTTGIARRYANAQDGWLITVRSPTNGKYAEVKQPWANERLTVRIDRAEAAKLLRQHRRAIVRSLKWVI